MVASCKVRHKSGNANPIAPARASCAWDAEGLLNDLLAKGG
jgi:hypothetical protein